MMSPHREHRSSVKPPLDRAKPSRGAGALHKRHGMRPVCPMPGIRRSSPAELFAVLTLIAAPDPLAVPSVGRRQARGQEDGGHSRRQLALRPPTRPGPCRSRRRSPCMGTRRAAHERGRTRLPRPSGHLSRRGVRRRCRLRVFARVTREAPCGQVRCAAVGVGAAGGRLGPAGRATDEGMRDGEAHPLTVDEHGFVAGGAGDRRGVTFWVAAFHPH
jgi:hypothetical protein